MSLGQNAVLEFDPTNVVFFAVNIDVLSERAHAWQRVVGGLLNSFVDHFLHAPLDDLTVKQKTKTYLDLLFIKDSELGQVLLDDENGVSGLSHLHHLVSSSIGDSRVRHAVAYQYSD